MRSKGSGSWSTTMKKMHSSGPARGPVPKSPSNEARGPAEIEKPSLAKEAGSKGTVAIRTQGCKLNQADSEDLARRFTEAGYMLVGPRERADVYVVNTCTVTHVADKKARQALGAAHRHNPGSLVVATGCYAQRSPGELARLPGVDLVAGNEGKQGLVETVRAARGDGPVACTVGEDPPSLAMALGRARAMVKIQEGCNQVCAYCIVPKVRGRERSIPPQEVLSQTRRRVQEGCKEVVLTGTQLGSYGFDLAGTDLRRLVALLLEKSGVERLRISSLQPQEITPEMLKLWADPRLCPHFHMPLQSGSDAVLKGMQRRYSARRYAQAMDGIRSAVPDVAITADMIVGFPGEDESLFRESLEFARGMGFASMHVFPYSVRQGTSAAHMEPKVADATRTRRMAQMLVLAREQSREFRRQTLGSVRKVLWERSEKRGEATILLGLTDNYLKVFVEGHLPGIGQITPARLMAEAGDSIQVQIDSH